jgi:predicted acylesterase/phospholipase RssA
MREIKPSLYVLVVAAAILLGFILWHENKIVEGDKTGMSYTSFNRSETWEAQQIMACWRKDDARKNAIEKIVLFDYLLIVLYTTTLIRFVVYRRNLEKKPPRQERRYWIIAGLHAAMFCILAGAVLDAIQDTVILYWTAFSTDRIGSLELLTKIKWVSLSAGVVLLGISLIPRSWLAAKLPTAVADISGFLKMIWTFFPSILFIFLVIYCFWLNYAGQDLMIAFTEKSHPGIFNPRIIFFLAIGFWVYTTWYSSRVIAYIKQEYSPITQKFLDNYPVLAGNACFLVLELAVLQSPILPSPLAPGDAFIILLLTLILLYRISQWIATKAEEPAKGDQPANQGQPSTWLKRRFRAALTLFLLLMLITIFFRGTGNLWYLLASIVSLHVVYLFYTNLHHITVRIPLRSNQGPRGFSEHIMKYFSIPFSEGGYFNWFIGISVLAILIDIMAIWWLGVSRDIGPFPMVILGFSVLLAFGNVVSAFSARYRINFHFLLFLIAFFSGLKETHYVRRIHLENSANHYDKRPALESFLRHWLNQRVDSGSKPYDTYFVLANGGASRSGYWTASVLGRLEDSSMKYCGGDRFSNHIFCLSGTSGGGVGVATFFSLLHDRHKIPDTTYEKSARHFLKQDYFTYTLARMLGPDYFNYIFHFVSDKDRGAALEESFEQYSDTLNSSLYKPYFNKPFSTFSALGPDSNMLLPLLFVNTTRMQDGNPGLVTNLAVDAGQFNRRIDVPSLLADTATGDSSTDISMASAAILGARFPYLSPAGRIRNEYFVDGGYFDNSGAGVVQELIQGIFDIMEKDRKDGGKLYLQIQRLHFKVLHIVNSPLGDSAILQPVKPINNDLFAPLETIVGAYSMQTTVNDNRLYQYIDDLRINSGVSTDHQEISLYKSSKEWKNDSAYTPCTNEEPYSMNWFMSEWTRSRIDQRLSNQPVVNQMIKSFK